MKIKIFLFYRFLLKFGAEGPYRIPRDEKEPNHDHETNWTHPACLLTFHRDSYRSRGKHL